MRKLFKERKLFKGGNYMRKYGMYPHRLRTHKESINQRNLKFWADMADKICFGRSYKFGIGI